MQTKQLKFNEVLVLTLTKLDADSKTIQFYSNLDLMEDVNTCFEMVAGLLERGIKKSRNMRSTMAA